MTTKLVRVQLASLLMALPLALIMHSTASAEPAGIKRSVPATALNATTDLSMTSIPLSDLHDLDDMTDCDWRQDFAATPLRRTSGGPASPARRPVRAWPGYHSETST